MKIEMEKMEMLFVVENEKKILKIFFDFDTQPRSPRKLSRIKDLVEERLQLYSHRPKAS